MTDYILREDAFMALTGDITDCTIEEFIARLRDKLSKLPSVGKDINITTNEDCISRQAVIDLYEKYHPYLATKVYEFGQELRKLPSVSQAVVKDSQGSGWIPVSKRLPETDDSVLLFYESHYCKYVGNNIVDKGINYCTTIAFYDEDNKEWYENTEWSRRSDFISYPLAWMPLPALYKEEKNENNS